MPAGLACGVTPASPSHRRMLCAGARTRFPVAEMHVSPLHDQAGTVLPTWSLPVFGGFCCDRDSLTLCTYCHCHATGACTDALRCPAQRATCFGFRHCLSPALVLAHGIVTRTDRIRSYCWYVMPSMPLCLSAVCIRDVVQLTHPRNHAERVPGDLRGMFPGVVCCICSLTLHSRMDCGVQPL